MVSDTAEETQRFLWPGGTTASLNQWEELVEIMGM